MSAFLCSDVHFSVIAHHIGNRLALNLETMQSIANELKRINIQSVNYRYNEKSRITKCKFGLPENHAKLTAHDILKIIDCYLYQACENHNNAQWQIVNNALQHEKSILVQLGANAKLSNIWSI